MKEFNKFLTEQLYRNIPEDNIYGSYEPIRSSNIVKVNGFYKPKGIQALGSDRNNIQDPDPGDGKDRDSDVIDIGLYPDLLFEYDNFGDGLYLESKTRDALLDFTRTPSYYELFAPGETRWGYRPPVINALAGGENASYHLQGKAVDLKLKKSASSITDQELMDCVWNALYSGFRGIGFGGGQFHFDTRPHGFLGYIYDRFPYKHTPPMVLHAAFRQKGMLDAARSMRDLSWSPTASDSDDTTRIHMSVNDINKYIRTELDAKNDADLQNADASGTSSSNTNSNRQTGVTGGTTGTTNVPSAGSAGISDTVIGIALGALILGGFFGFRNWLRQRKDRRERREAEKYSMQLLRDRQKRAIISDFRDRHYTDIKIAQRDPRVAERLEFMLMKELQKYGLSAY